MPRVTSFSIGQRWRVKPEVADQRRDEGKRDWCWDFVIVGPATYGDPKTYKTCRLEPVEHCCKPDSKTCVDGVTQSYPHRHLKKYAYWLKPEN